MPAPNLIDLLNQALKSLQDGGIILFPSDVGYAFATLTEEGLAKISRSKGRHASKRCSMLGTLEISNELQILPELERKAIANLLEIHKVPLCVVAPFDRNHPKLAHLSPQAIDYITINDTLNCVAKSGEFSDLLAQACWDKLQKPVFGSSANFTQTGNKFSVSDVEPEMRAICDLIVDVGLAKGYTQDCPSTILDFHNHKVIRIGHCYETIKDFFKRFYGLEFAE